MSINASGGMSTNAAGGMSVNAGAAGGMSVNAAASGMGPSASSVAPQGAAWEVASWRSQVAIFRVLCEVADEASDVRVEGSGAFGRMRGVPRVCAEVAGRSGN